MRPLAASTALRPTKLAVPVVGPAQTVDVRTGPLPRAGLSTAEPSAFGYGSVSIMAISVCGAESSAAVPESSTGSSTVLGTC